MNITRIIAIRHGETDWNANARIQGHIDIDLNQNGQNQAAQLAKYLKSLDQEKIQTIYTSPLKRAETTAKALAKQINLKIQKHAGLKERNFGDFQGLTFAQITEKYPEEAKQWKNREENWTPPAGESLKQFQTRVINTITEIASKNQNQTIAIFTHGGVLDVLYRASTKIGLKDTRTWQIQNTAINRLLWTQESGLTLQGWADMTHLTQTNQKSETEHEHN